MGFLSGAAAWTPAILVLLTSVAIAAILETRPRRDHSPIAALFPPWWDQARALRAASNAGLSVSGVGVLPSMIVLRRARGGDIGRLRGAGAWLVFDPGVLPVLGTVSRQ